MIICKFHSLIPGVEGDQEQKNMHCNHTNREKIVLILYMVARLFNPFSLKTSAFIHFTVNSQAFWRYLLALEQKKASEVYRVQNSNLTQNSNACQAL
jgi:hypothetical protein